MADLPLVPSHTALINVDMQNCFVEGSRLSSPDGLDVLERINVPPRPAEAPASWWSTPAGGAPAASTR